MVPQQGYGLLFIHDTWHEGAEVSEGFKYVLRSDVMCAVRGSAEWELSDYFS